MNNILVISRDVGLLAIAGFMLRLVLNIVYCRRGTGKKSSMALLHATYLDSPDSGNYQLASSQLIQIKIHHTSFYKQS